MCKKYLILIIATLYDVSETAKILAVFPVPSLSHQIYFRHITHELLRRGHEITVITTDPAFPKTQAPANLTEIDVHDISYIFNPAQRNEVPMGSPDDVYPQIYAMYNISFHAFEKQLQTEEVKNLMTKKFDLLLLEAMVSPTLVLSHFFKAPVILISSLGPLPGFESIVGAPYHPLLYPMFFQQKLSNLSFMDKIRELLLNYFTQNTYYAAEERYRESSRNMFGQEVPTLSELKRNVDLVLLNVHPIWVNNQPVPPNVVYIGGIHTNTEKAIPQDLKSYLDASPKGVIYMSFGSNVSPSVLPPKRMDILKRVFSDLPYNILWKWDQDDMPGKPKNVKIAKWLPQTDLLKHPNVKLFIMQGGLQSTDEAINAGVPLIGVPMLGDQWYNAEMYVRHKIGLRLDLHTMTEETLSTAINTLMNDESYRHNIRRLKSLIHDSPEKPLDRAMWWIEHIIRHGGGAHLRSPAANMPWTQYFELELILILLSIVIVFLTILLLGVYFIYLYVRRNFMSNTKHKKS